MDTTQSSDSNKLRLYINGNEATYGTDNRSSISEDDDLGLLSGINHYYGIRSNGSMPFDGYMAELNVVDGSSLGPTSFGELKNGTWIPVEYSSSYGTQGWRLQFINTTLNSSGAAGSSSTVGADTSGNGNHWQAENITADDINMPDSPENNFAIFNTLTGHTATTMSQGNLRALAANSSNILESQSSTIGVTSGKWYAEFRADDLVNDGQNNGTQIGVTTVPFNRGSGNQNGYVVGNTRVNLDQNTGAYLGVNQDLTQNNIGTYADGDIIGVALDVDNSQVSFYKNGSAITNATNASITVVNALHFFEIQVRKYDGDTSQITANFGQDSTFSGAVSAGNNTDGNGKGDFKYSVPSGYLALCSANLPDTTISPSKSSQADDHFVTVPYTGNGSTTQNISIGLKPDWVWLKSRSNNSGYHTLVDSSRGDIALGSDQSIAEYSVSEFNINTDNTIDVVHYGNNYSMNTNAATFVA